MGDVKLRLSKTPKNQSLSVSCKTTGSVSSFLNESIKAAKKIASQNREGGILLFLENSFESLVTLESFIEAGVKFEVAFLSCGQVTSRVLDNWVDFFTSNQIVYHEVKFDFGNDDHLTELRNLRNQFNFIDIQSLFNTWAACHFNQYVVFPGNFCFPKLDATMSIGSFGLPGIEALAIYNFAQLLGAEPFFVTGTYAQIKATISSDFTAAIVRLQKDELRRVPNSHELKKVFCNSLGLKKMKSLRVAYEREPLWSEALRYEGRGPNLKISKILNDSRILLNSDVQQVEKIGKLSTKIIKTEKQNKLLRQLREVSCDLNNTGSLIKLSENKNGDKVYAAFPLLMKAHWFNGDISKIENFLSGVLFNTNSTNLISANDLHLYPEIAPLIKFFNEKIDTYFKTQGRLVYDFEITQCWANKASYNQEHHPHSHSNTMVGGVFYLNDGGGGDTIFTKEIPEAGIIHTNLTKVTAFNGITVRIRPQKGKLILFPGHLMHYVLAHAQKENVRYSIAFNAFIRGTIGNFNEGAWIDLRRNSNITE